MCGINLETLRRLAASRVHVNTGMDAVSVSDMLQFPSIPTFATGALLEHQIEHSERLNYVLDTKGSAGDTSPPGRGKTYVASACAKKQNLPVLVFCPKAAISIWWRVLRAWGVPVATITNYDMARSSHSDTIVKWYDMRNGYTEDTTVCPWITKEKVRPKATSNNKSNKSLLTTKDSINFRWHLPYKCFIIFDEEHVGKNIHTQTFSFIKGAVQASRRQGHKTLFLSATPIEKKVNLKSILYFLGLISRPDMNAVNSFFRERMGSTEMTDIHKYLYAVDPTDPRKSTGSMSSMPDAYIPDGIVNDVRPIAFPMTEEATKQIAERNKEILLLRERLRERVYDNTLGSINANRRFVESYKVDKAEELAIAGFKGTFPVPEVNPETKIPTGKITYKGFKRVAIFVNYKSTLHDLAHRLSTQTGTIDGREQHLGPYISVLHGDQSKQESDQAALDYNTGKTKILISTIRKGGLSLSFHDTIGDKETLVIIFPPTSATDLLQTLGRHFRTNIMSSVTQVILFTLGDKIEESIRDALASKMDDILNFTSGTSTDFDLYDLADRELVPVNAISVETLIEERTPMTTEELQYAFSIARDIVF